MPTFDELIKLPDNEPVIVVQMQPKERLISGWANVSGTIYKMTTDFFVVDVAEDGVSLVEAGSSSVSSDEWFFDDATKEVFVDVGEDPANTFLHVCYRLFYSTRPIDLPFDMASGREVPYNGLVESTSKFKDEINSDDLVGIALSGTGDVSFFNDGTWSDIYGRLFWETTKVNIYFGFPEIAATAYKLVYKGFVDTKSFAPEKIKFGLKDFIEKLRSEVPLNLFSDSDGEITAQDKPKKRIYGRAKVLGVSLDKVKDQFLLTGTFTRTTSTTITGVGSTFLTELAVGDDISFIDTLGDEVSYSVLSIDSTTVITLTEEINEFDAASTMNCTPTRGAVPFRNRTHFICDHQMRAPATTVSGVTGSLRHFKVASQDDLFSGDKITLNGETKIIDVVSEADFLSITTSLTAIPSISDAVTKEPVFNVWKDDVLLVLTRDYTITNGDPSKIVLDVLAEFNLAKPKPLTDGSSTAITLTNGSDEVTGNIAFLDFFEVWDWIRGNDVTHTTWYQILDVQEDKLILRSNYAGATRTNDGERRNIDIIGDDTRILIDAAGITENGVKTGVWVDSASKVVEHLLTEQSLLIDTTSFNQADLDAPYLMSLIIPLANSSSRPKVRDIVDVVNQSILGSLHENSDRDIVYSVLSPRKAVITEIFRDDDLLKYTIESTGKNIASKVTANYRHEDADIFTGELDFDVIEFTNQFIDFISDVEREEQIDLYLWHTNDATILTQRISLLREAANTIVKMDSNTLFMDRALNELVYLELRDMFNRFGTEADQNFIGVINLLSKSGDGTRLEVTDLGGFYNKIATYAGSTASGYAGSSQIDRASDGYWTDANGIIDDSKQSRLNVFG